jgi:ubiquitin-protein ligase
MEKMNMARFIKDIKEIVKNPIDNIYYKHDETNMLKGYALIIGPVDTPYAYGNYLFEFTFPTNYPFDPPKVTYFTNDGSTRFNPNLYIDGKVCLSVLNTWKGEGWSSCQNIRSILLVLSTVLNEMPIENEPGLTRENKDNTNYNNMIKYKNLEIAIIGMLSKKQLDHRFLIFYDTIVERFLQNQEEIRLFLEKLKVDLANTDNFISNFNLYNSKYIINLASLELKLKKFDNIK